MNKAESERQNKGIKKGDQVYIISGNDKGTNGKVLSRTNDRVIVQGINMRKRHVKKTQQNPNGGIIQVECSINITNVAKAKE